MVRSLLLALVDRYLPVPVTKPGRWRWQAPILIWVHETDGWFQARLEAIDTGLRRKMVGTNRYMVRMGGPKGALLTNLSEIDTADMVADYFFMTSKGDDHGPLGPVLA